MKNEKEDRRLKMTRRLLKDALVELMKTRSIHEISVKKLCETADVNRSTFYRHYESQYDLCQEILDDVSAEIYVLIERRPAGPNRLRLLLTDILTYLEEERELILVLLSKNGNLNIGEMFSKIVGRLIQEDETTEMAAYCTQFITAGVTSIVWLWLNKEDRRSPKDIAMLMNVLFLHGVKKAMLLAGRDDLLDSM